jgi:uroporphyrinogen III methyltransferase/synthase
MSKSKSPLSGKRVLVTRPAHQSSEFAAALEAAGAIPVLASAIALQPPRDEAAAIRAVNDAATYAWIVFTSGNGVNAFFRLLDARREDARALGNARVAAIGIKTAQALRAEHVFADLVPQSYVAEDLAEALIAASNPGDKMLIFRAEEARDVLPERLRAAGREPHIVAAYKTVYTEDPLYGGKVAQSDILTFTSASTVRGFSHNLGGDEAAARASQRKLVACIGPITAQAARDAGMHVDVVADEFTANGLLRAIELHLSGNA